jgi:hypothetical protein
VELDKVNFAKEYREKCYKNLVFVDGRSEMNSFKFRILRMPILLGFLNSLNIFVNMRFMDKAVPEGLGPLFEIEVDKFNLNFVQSLAEAIIKQEKHYTCRNNSLCVSFDLKKEGQKLRCTLDCFNGSIRYTIPFPDFHEEVYKEPNGFLEQALSKISIIAEE